MRRSEKPYRTKVKTHLTLITLSSNSRAERPTELKVDNQHLIVKTSKLSPCKYATIAWAFSADEAVIFAKCKIVAMATIVSVRGCGPFVVSAINSIMRGRMIRWRLSFHELLNGDKSSAVICGVWKFSRWKVRVFSQRSIYGLVRVVFFFRCRLLWNFANCELTWLCF